jgi:hypothetical protein
VEGSAGLVRLGKGSGVAEHLINSGLEQHRVVCGLW